ncbi:hypothetical protein RCL1_004256 [Eukaryota sp. TZLM3-RCL]
MVILTRELVESTTGLKRLDEVVNINMWGKGLTDVSLVRQLPNASVLSFSVNEISTLEDFAFCPKLTELYLRKNKITDLRSIRHLKDLKHLTVLWLCNNPCSETDIYRMYVLHYLPNLVKLDNNDVTQQERAQAASFVPPSHLSLSPPVQVPPPQPSTPIEPSPVEVERDDRSIDRKGKPLRELDSSSQNIIKSIVYLLRELDASGLRVVRAELEKQLDIKR